MKVSLALFIQLKVSERGNESYFGAVYLITLIERVLFLGWASKKKSC